MPTDNTITARSCMAIAAAMSLTMMVITPASATGAADSPNLKALQQQVEQLKQQLQAMEQKVDDALAQAANANQQVQAVHDSVAQANSVALTANTNALAAIEAPENADVKFRFAGAVVANYGVSSHASQGMSMAPGGTGSNSTFTGGAFMPIFLLKYKDLAEIEAHLEFMNMGGETHTSLEYAQIDLFLNDWATVVAGKFLSPIGQFQQSLHPAWVNKLPDRPAGFVEGGGGEPLSEVGVQVRGAFPIGNMTADYAVFAGNGPQLGEEGLALEGNSHDNNNNKSFGARFGLRPIDHLDIGVSAMHSKVTSNAEMLMPGMFGSSASHDLYDFDFSYTPPNVDIRGEYIHGRLQPVWFDDSSGDDPSLLATATWRLWYLQGAYRFAGMTDNPTLGKFEVVSRVSQNKVSGGSMDWRMSNEKRVTVGLNYWWSPTLVGKIAYEHKNFEYLTTDNLLRMQLVFGF